MSDADEIEVYVDSELLTRAKGALMLAEGREPTDDETIGKALEAFVDEKQTTEVDGSNQTLIPPERRISTTEFTNQLPDSIGGEPLGQSRDELFAFTLDDASNSADK